MAEAATVAVGASGGGAVTDELLGADGGRAAGENGSKVGAVVGAAAFADGLVMGSGNPGAAAVVGARSRTVGAGSACAGVLEGSETAARGSVVPTSARPTQKATMIAVATKKAAATPRTALPRRARCSDAVDRRGTAEVESTFLEVEVCSSVARSCAARCAQAAVSGRKSARAAA